MPSTRSRSGVTFLGSRLFFCNTSDEEKDDDDDARSTRMYIQGEQVEDVAGKYDGR